MTSAAGKMENAQVVHAVEPALAVLKHVLLVRYQEKRKLFLMQKNVLNAEHVSVPASIMQFP
jgi:hypothetical protein